MIDKRGLVVILVISTVVIFVGLVWAISTYLPMNLGAAPSPTLILDARREVVNCVSPIVFWMQHPELYPAQAVIAGQVYKAADLNTIFSVPGDDLSTKLRAQLTGAYLNILSGADQSYIETTIFEAYAWLVQHSAGSQVTDSEREEGTRLFNLLEGYNLGLTGVKACEITLLPSTQGVTETETATITVTVTPSPTGTPAASETQTQVEVTETATYIYIPPTRAPTKTSAPPIQYPTNTPVQPTQAPTPTNPPAPTAAPTNTAPPPPTLPPPTPTLPQPSPTLP
jgi:hypothetical protein